MRYAFVVLLVLPLLVSGAANGQAQVDASRVDGSPPVVAPLRSEDALAVALQANPTMRASLLSIVAARAGTRAAHDARAPVLRADLNGAYRESFSGTTQGVVRNDSQSVAAGIGLDWTSDVGTTVSLDLSAAASWRRVNLTAGTSMSVSIGPNYDAQLLAAVRQPILRGAGRDATLAAEREAGAAERRAVATRDTDVAGIVRDVLRAYWELWYAEEALRVQVDAESLAQRQLDEAISRVELGTLAPIERLRLASELASLREARRSAELERVSRKVQLAALLAAEPESITVDRLPPAPQALAELRDLLARAEAESPDLAALDAAVEEARQRGVVSRNNARARLDFVASAGVETLFAEDALPGLQLPDGRPAFVATGGFELELPLGSSAADARHEQARAQLESAQNLREAGALTLRASVRSAYEAASAAAERLPLAEESAAISHQLAEAERERLAIGTTTTVSLLEAQQSAREAELRRLRVLVDTATAAHELEFAAGVLLDRFLIAEAVAQPDAERTDPPHAH
jgi:outer membrane protein TolC